MGWFDQTHKSDSIQQRKPRSEEQKAWDTAILTSAELVRRLTDDDNWCFKFTNCYQIKLLYDETPRDGYNLILH